MQDGIRQGRERVICAENGDDNTITCACISFSFQRAVFHLRGGTMIYYGMALYFHGKVSNFHGNTITWKTEKHHIYTD